MCWTEDGIHNAIVERIDFEFYDSNFENSFNLSVTVAHKFGNQCFLISLENYNDVKNFFKFCNALTAKNAIGKAIRIEIRKGVIIGFGHIFDEIWVY